MVAWMEGGEGRGAGGGRRNGECCIWELEKGGCGNDRELDRMERGRGGGGGEKRRDRSLRLLIFGIISLMDKST